MQMNPSTSHNTIAQFGVLEALSKQQRNEGLNENNNNTHAYSNKVEWKCLCGDEKLKTEDLWTYQLETNAELLRLPNHQIPLGSHQHTAAAAPSESE